MLGDLTADRYFAEFTVCVGTTFTSRTGCPRAPDTFTAAYRKFVKGVGIGHIRFHDLRHTHASQLLRHGIHIKVVSERLGHSTVAITLDTYSHILPGMQEEAASKIDAALNEAFDSQS